MKFKLEYKSKYETILSNTVTNIKEITPYLQLTKLVSE